MAESQLRGRFSPSQSAGRAGRIDIIGAGPELGDMFKDPRRPRDRRQRDEPDRIPESGCRRKAERRTMVYMNGDDWWMRRNYNNAEGESGG